MFEQMMKRCCGPDGSPDFDKMMHFMKQHDRTSKYDAIGWGLFFIWVGVAWITDVGWGIGLLGVAAITLGMQVARKISGEAVEGFWVLVGIGFAVAGFWELWAGQLPLAPFVLIIIGLALLLWTTRSRSARTGSRADSSKDEESS
jgi:hypothetical protein